MSFFVINKKIIIQLINKPTTQNKMRKRISKLIAYIMILPLAISCQNTDKKENQSASENDTKQEMKVWKIPNVHNAAEAYFSPDGQRMIGNAKFEDDSAHMVYTLGIDGTDIKRINDKGVDACSFYYPDGKKLIWTSTRDNLDMKKGNYSDPRDYPQGAELYSSDLEGGNIVRLTDNQFYDAEVSVSPDGSKILFSRQINGSLDLWVMNSDRSNEHQITFTEDDQEGGAFYMPDSEIIIYRSWSKSEEGKRGMAMTIFTIKDDGSDLKQITHEEGTNWAPYPCPDGKCFVFIKVLPPMNFEIFLMNIETGNQTRLTYNDAFDGFPVVSPDGKTLAFSSNRDAKEGERTLTLYLMDISSLNL